LNKFHRCEQLGRMELEHLVYSANMVDLTGFLHSRIAWDNMIGGNAALQ
jgi:hypothetical protein